MRFKRRDDRSKRKRITKFLLGLVVVAITLVGKRVIIDFLRPAHYHNGEHRIAIIIPFLSPSTMLPPYFSIFLQTAGGSAAIVDFLVFHNGQLATFINESESTIQGFEYPDNVKFISLESMEKFASYFVQVADRRLEGRQEDQDKLVKILSRVMKRSPYMLVEFKPAFGYIFRHFIQEYSHWGYSDFDVAFGDLPRWITRGELNDWDIVTYSYGDQGRIYLRGQFTFHQNKERINNIWRKCLHLSELDLRYEKILAGEKKLELISAEGCYSNAVITTANIAVKYSVKAMSDVQDHNKNSLEYGITIAIGKKGDRSVLYKAGEGREAGERFLRLPKFWFEKDKYYSTQDMQWESSVRQNLNESKVSPGCMYWMKEEYQTDICYKGITSSDTVMLIHGQLYKQQFEEQIFPHRIVSRSFFHFQEWKRSLRTDQLYAFSHRTMEDNGKIVGWQLFQEGAVALSTTSKRFPKLNIPSKKLKAKTDVYVPSTFFCISSSGKKSHSSPECDYAVSWKSINVSTKTSEDWGEVAEEDITLVLVLELNSHPASLPDNNQHLLKILEANVKVWRTSPVIILVYVSGTKDFASFVSNQLDKIVTSRTQYLVGIIHDKIRNDHIEGANLNSLLNMAEAAGRTRWLLSGMEVNRGLVLSAEALLFCRRAIYAHNGATNDVYILGQIDFDSKIMSEKKSSTEMYSSLSISDIRNKTQSNAYKIVPKRRTEHELEKEIYRTWMDASITELFHSQNDVRRLHLDEINTRARSSANIQVRLASVLGYDNRTSHLHFSSHPLLLIDKMGSAGLIPEISELSGNCVNALRLAQFAAMDYNIMMLPGAFAASKKEFSHLEKESSSCDLQAMEEHATSILREQIVLTYKQIAMNQIA